MRISTPDKWFCIFLPTVYEHQHSHPSAWNSPLQLTKSYKTCKVLSPSPNISNSLLKTVYYISTFWPTAAAAKSLQSCPTLCDPRDGSPPGSPVPGILQARTLKWVAIPFSNAWTWKVKVKLLSRVWPSATPRTTAFQAPPSTGFSRQEHWSGCHRLLRFWPTVMIILTLDFLFSFPS